MLEATRKSYSRNRNADGFSVIEVMITVVVFLIVMAAIFGVLRAGNIMRSTVSDRSEVTANARAALDFIGREAVNAGLGYSRTGGIVGDDLAFDLFEIPRDPDTERDLFPGVLAGNNISASDLSVNGEKNDVVAFLARDLEFNDGDPIIIEDWQQTSNHTLITTEAAGCQDCSEFDLFMIESSDSKQALAMVTDVRGNRFVEFKDDDPLGLNKRVDLAAPDRSILTECAVGETANCFNYTPQATAKRVFMTSYSVDQSGTLVRKTYGNNTGADENEQIQVHPIAHGVQNFQVRYLMQDGTISDDPSNGNTDQMKLNEVVQVEIRITIKSETSQNGVTSTQLINLDSTFSMRNLRYDFE